MEVIKLIIEKEEAIKRYKEFMNEFDNKLFIMGMKE